MQCPLHDAELSHHTAQGENGLMVSYATCPTCHGYWMDSFAANFIKIKHADHTARMPTASAYYCPVCNQQLVRSTGDNIPDGVYVLDCPRHHGYFFPTSQLAAFKKAQKTKIEYHKLWNIPMPNVGSILLGGLVLLILSGGLAFTYQGLQQKQTTESQARQILAAHAVFPTADHTAILMSATTSIPAVVTLHIPSLNNFSVPMQTKDNRTHLSTIQQLPPSTYRYFFTITASGNTSTSETYTLTVQ